MKPLVNEAKLRLFEIIDNFIISLYFFFYASKKLEEKKREITGYS